MGLLLYLNDTNTVTGFIENISRQEAEKIVKESAERTVFLENTEFPEYKKHHVIKYNGFEFYYERVTEEPIPEPTEQELIQAELLLNQIDIIAKQNEQDEVLAEILLNQMGV